jgi:LysM repeat protein
MYSSEIMISDICFWRKSMASYNESAFKIKKSDIVIYIVALLAFVLMIVVLMSDKLGVSKRVTSLIGNSSTDTSQIVTAGNESRSLANNQSSGLSTSQGVRQGASGASQDINRELVNDLQRSENVPSEGQQLSTQPASSSSSSRRTEQAQRSGSSSDTANTNSSASGIRAEISDEHSGMERASGSRTEINRENSSSTSSSQLSVQRERADALARARETSARVSVAKKKKKASTPHLSRRNRVARAAVSDIGENGGISTHASLKISRKVTVRNGDVIWKLALRYGVRTINIIKVNNLSNPNLIFPGQVLNIPNK